MSKPFFADVGDLTTANIGTSNETIANIGTGNVILGNLVAVAFTGEATTIDIGGLTENDFSPTGLAVDTFFNVIASSAATITGLNASVVAAGRMIYLYAPITNAASITLTEEDAGSLAPNRFQLPNGTAFVLNPGSCATLRYDGGAARWRLASVAASIASSSITNAQLAKMAALTVKANATNALANPQDVASSATGSIFSQQGNALVWGPLQLSNTIAPASLAAGNANDYAPAGLASAETIRQAVNASVVATITGLTAQGSGRRITFQNLGTGQLTFSNEDANSVAANRFSLPGSAAWELVQNSAMTFVYDSTTSRWIAEDMTPCTPFVQINVTASPAAITGTQNDYNPTNLASSGVLRQALSGSAILTGLTAQIDGRVIFLENISTTLALTLNNEDAGSTAANRFTLPGGTALVVNPGGCIVLIYDNTSARWRALSQVGTFVPVSSPSLGSFGDGIDGALNFDGVATITLAGDGSTMVPAANVYTMARDIYPSTMVIAAGVTVIGAGFFIFAHTSVNGPGTYHCNGRAGSAGGVAGGAGGVSFGTSRYNKAGTTGGAGSTTTGAQNGAAGSTAPPEKLAGLSAIGGPGNAPHGGGGGGNGATGAGGQGGNVTVASATGGSYKTLTAVIAGFGGGGNTLPLQGAAGGGGGGVTGQGGGGGGAGGGPVGLFTPLVLGPINVSSNGGAGGNGSAGGNTGGGGGGGGGHVIVLALIGGGNITVTVTGGAPGAGNGTGASGGVGAAGTSTIF